VFTCVLLQLHVPLASTTRVMLHTMSRVGELEIFVVHVGQQELFRSLLKLVLDVSSRYVVIVVFCYIIDFLIFI